MIQSWRLNERHNGSLVGLSKAGAERMYGKTQLDVWRHSWTGTPPPMDQATKREWEKQEHCRLITTIHKGNDAAVTILEKSDAGHSWCGSIAEMPVAESLEQTCHRVLPFWERALAPRLLQGETVLVAAHANTVKALLKVLDPTVVADEVFSSLRIPSATPLVYEFQGSTSGSIPGGLQIVPPVPKALQEGAEMRYQLQGEWIDVSLEGSSISAKMPRDAES
jgi:2,3-bisphosphoglycerate-dependent phosphoglycerate mutase